MKKVWYLDLDNGEYMKYNLFGAFFKKIHTKVRKLE